MKNSLVLYCVFPVHNLLINFTCLSFNEKDDADSVVWTLFRSLFLSGVPGTDLRNRGWGGMPPPNIENIGGHWGAKLNKNPNIGGGAQAKNRKLLGAPPR